MDLKAKNLGPISEALIPIDPEGGITVLTGSNGSGKSMLLNAASKMLGGPADPLTARDGHPKGMLEGAGLRLSVAKSTRVTGTCEVTAIEGKYDVHDIVDPGIKDTDAADAKRIKALLALRETEADIAAFHDLAGGRADFEAMVSADTLKTKDVVELARKVKRDLEGAARREASLADIARGKAEACEEAAAEVDTSKAGDEAALNARLEDAIKHKASLEGRRETARRVHSDAAFAREKIAEAEKTNSLATVEVCREGVEQADRDRRDAEVKRQEAQRALDKAEGELEFAEAALKNARDNLAHAERTEQALAGWRESVAKAEDLEAVSAEDVEAADEAIQEARAAITRNTEIAMALQKLADAKRHEETAEGHAKRAKELRESAKSTDIVLSDAVASSSGLWVEDGRLMARHPRRGDMCFADMSQGERWRIALDEAIERIRAEGNEEVAIIPVPQECWEGLDQDNRRAVHEHAKKRRVTILTAQAGSGPVRAEVFTPLAEAEVGSVAP